MKPLEPFLVDDQDLHSHPGRFARSSIDMLWTWIQRDTLPYDAKAVDEKVSAALQAGDEAKAQYFILSLQDRVADVLTESLRSAGSDENFHRRLLAQFGTQRAGEDTATL